jgi:Sulfotransferase family/Aspartyl/Asparaginyl beta-hydroxylase
MKLDYPFIQLPLTFDAERLLAEITAVGESAWKPHPQGFAGNYAMTLITPHGVNDSDEMSGPMLPTDYLKSCPYLMDVLRCMGGVWGRTRLMKLSGQAEVSPHVDVDYYWRERMRVHVPIVTQDSVRFHCGNQNINMKAGECWVFDTWSLHKVINDAEQARIHLVADTVGGEVFRKWLRAGRPNGIAIPGWQAYSVDTNRESLPALRLESRNQPDVMTPWEMREHFSFLFNESVPNPDLKGATAATFELCNSWHALWTECGDDEVAHPRYAQLIAGYLGVMQKFGHLKLRNGSNLMQAITNGVTGHCLKNQFGKFEEHRLTGSEPIGDKIPAAGGKIERPIIIVSSPRSGSTMFFEALEKHAEVSSIGGESHELFESIFALHPASRNYESNALSALDCSEQISRQLHARFYQSASKQGGSNVRPDEPVRLLEKTPKNALRIRFMKQLFPDAQFIYLYRDPRHVISSMIDAWQSGRFRTYPDLPGWQGLPWSLLLIPGWRDLIGKPLHHAVAQQWATATRIMLDDLADLDPGSVIKIRYETLLARPQDELERICRSCGLAVMQDLQGFPLSQHTLTPPNPEKWKKNARLIDEIWPIVAEQADRAEAYMMDTH